MPFKAPVILSRCRLFFFSKRNAIFGKKSVFILCFRVHILWKFQTKKSDLSQTSLAPSPLPLSAPTRLTTKINKIENILNKNSKKSIIQIMPETRMPPSVVAVLFAYSAVRASTLIFQDVSTLSLATNFFSHLLTFLLRFCGVVLLGVSVEVIFDF